MRKTVKDKRTLRDYLLPATIIAAALFLLSVLIPLTKGIIMRSRFNTFKERLAYTIELSLDNPAKPGALLTEGETSVRIEPYRVNTFYFRIVDADLGKEQKTAPPAEPVTLAFANGAVLEIRETAIPEKGRRNEEGVYIRYRERTGYEYAYDTDLLQMRFVRAYLGLAEEEEEND